MNILFACHRYPFPPNRGGKIRPFHTIRHLGQQHELTVASLAHSDAELRQGAGLQEYCREVIAEVVPSAVRWRQAALAFAAGKSASVAYFWSRRLFERVLERSRETRFDLALVHCAFAGQYVAALNCEAKIVDFGDLDSGKWFDYARDRRFPFSLGYGLEAQRLRRYEIALARSATCCTVTTTGELDEYQTLGRVPPCTVVPNGVDFSYFQPSPRAKSPHKVVFLGRMDYYPNIEAVVHFVRDLLPRIRERQPKAEFWIVGANPTPAVKNLARKPGVTVSGSVADVRPLVQDAAVAVAPLRLARGTQNKVLESIAMGIPVVCTPEAARGVRAVPQQHLLVADRPGDFAAAVMRLLEEPESRARMAEQARQYIAETHSWTHSMEILDGVIAGTRQTLGAAADE